MQDQKGRSVDGYVKCSSQLTIAKSGYQHASATQKDFSRTKDSNSISPSTH